jgi:Flp pilus assembly pilin Flp
MNKKKGQAIVEYVLIVALTAIAFTSMTSFFDKAVLSFFKMVGNFFSQKGP